MQTRGRVVPVVLAIVVATALAAPQHGGADVDLTGTWLVQADIAGTFQVTLMQTGTSLAWEPGGYVGTIDPSTGTFSLAGDPLSGGVIGDFPYGPSPNPTIDATASLDGARFSGTFLAWLIKVTPPVDFTNFPWFGIGGAIQGERVELIACGNGTTDVGEQCDHGATNGADGCCSAGCTLVADQDYDGVCDARDNCPHDWNPDQQNVCNAPAPFTVTAARVRANLDGGSVRIKGLISSAAAQPGVTGIEVAVGGTPLVSGTVTCVGVLGRRIRCTDPSRRLRLRFRIGHDDRVRVKLSTCCVPISPPIAVPVSVIVTDPMAHRWGGDIATCIGTVAGLRCR